MFKHIILFKFREKADANKAKLMLEALVGKVPTLRSMEAGVNILDTYRSWDLSLIATFDDKAGYEAYDEHPEHLKVREFIKGARLESAAVDYEL